MVYSLDSNNGMFVHSDVFGYKNEKNEVRLIMKKKFQKQINTVGFGLLLCFHNTLSLELLSSYHLYQGIHTLFFFFRKAGN